MNDAPDETHPEEEYMKADICLDPDGDELPHRHLEEVHICGVLEFRGSDPIGWIRVLMSASILLHLTLYPCPVYISLDHQ